jgi:hypothetical protein
MVSLEKISPFKVTKEKFFLTGKTGMVTRRFACLSWKRNCASVANFL